MLDKDIFFGSCEFLGEAFDLESPPVLGIFGDETPRDCRKHFPFSRISRVFANSRNLSILRRAVGNGPR